MSTSIVLVCAVLASLTAGVLIAYAICLIMFQTFRAHSRQVRDETRAVVPVPVTQA